MVFRKKDLYLIIMQKLIFLKSSGFHVKSSGFLEIHPKLYKIRCFNQNSSVWGVQGGGYDPGFHEILVHSPSPAFIKLNSFGWNICFYKVLGGFHMKSAGFHEIERPLARNCNPMFWSVSIAWNGTLSFLFSSVYTLVIHAPELFWARQKSPENNELLNKMLFDYSQ